MINISTQTDNQCIVSNHFWFPIQSIIDKLIIICNQSNYKNILEIGPGLSPFPIANYFIGFNEKLSNYINIDIDQNIIPFHNNFFHFLYSRHTLEDIQNPSFALSQMFRVSSNGFIETPSPIIEITKGVDNSYFNQLYSGYVHHRYIIWSNIKNNHIYILPKYSCIIDNLIHANNPDVINLLQNPIYWNNYFIWNNNNIPTITNYKVGVNINPDTFVQDYINIIHNAINDSIANTNYFIHEILKL